MNVLFLAEHPQLFVEYAARLERNGIPFWTADNNNAFHQLMVQVKVEAVFADYNLMDFDKFDVYKHIARHRNDMVFLFLNKPGSKGDVLVQWEEQVRENFPALWTKELEYHLRIMADKPMQQDFSLRPASVKDLLEQIECGKQGRGQDVVVAVPPVLESSVDLQEQNDLHSGEKYLGVDFGDGTIEEFLLLRRKYKVGYHDYVLMNLFFKHKNEIVELDDMLRLLKFPRDKKSINAMYHSIYRIRSYLQKKGYGRLQLVRVKKGCYSLISLNQ